MVDGGESGNDREGINGVQDCFNPARNIGLLMSKEMMILMKTMRIKKSARTMVMKKSKI